jgi:hypothetical protein
MGGGSVVDGAYVHAVYNVVNGKCAPSVQIILAKLSTGIGIAPLNIPIYLFL